MRIKKSFVIISVFMLFILFAVAVYAGSGSYSSTYSMYGGVHSRQMDVGSNPSFTVSITPTVWPSDANTITLYLQQQYLLGWGDASGSVTKKAASCKNPGTYTLLGKDDAVYRIYLRNYTGELMKGKVSFRWSW